MFNFDLTLVYYFICYFSSVRLERLGEILSVFSIEPSWEEILNGSDV